MHKNGNKFSRSTLSVREHEFNSPISNSLMVPLTECIDLCNELSTSHNYLDPGGFGLNPTPSVHNYLQCQEWSSYHDYNMYWATKHNGSQAINTGITGAIEEAGESLSSQNQLMNEFHPPT